MLNQVNVKTRKIQKLHISCPPEENHSDNCFSEESGDTYGGGGVSA